MVHGIPLCTCMGLVGVVCNPYTDHPCCEIFQSILFPVRGHLQFKSRLTVVSRKAKEEVPRNERT